MKKYIDNYIFEKYLDNNEEYYDYGTDPVSGNQIIDTNHTGVSFYDQFLGTSELDYLRDKKNLKGEIVMMSPQEYYEICASKIFNTSVERLKKERGEFDRHIIDKLHNVVKVYKRKLCLPFINYADQGQEGLHRMFTVAEILGWNHKVPVLVVDWYDKDRAAKEKNEKKKYEIDNRVNSAIEKALKYNYRSVEDLKDQLQWELDRSFEFYYGVESPVKFELTEEKNSFLLTTFGYEYPIDKDDINFVEDTSNDDSDLDDVDIDDIDNWLANYLGDNWEKEFPHVKDKILKNESLKFEESVPNKFYHATFLPRWKEIQKSGGLSTKTKYKNWEDSRNVICISVDPDAAYSYAETAMDDMSEEYPIVVLEINSEYIDPEYLYVDGNILWDEDEEITEFEYTKNIPLDAITVYSEEEL